MPDSIFLRLDPKFALGADELQWIVYRSRRKAPSPVNAPFKLGRGAEWEPVAFVRSTKAVLLRVLREKGCDGCEAALAGTSQTFAAWKARQGSGHNLKIDLAA
jgi:hypothetical protein